MMGTGAPPPPLLLLVMVMAGGDLVHLVDGGWSGCVGEGGEEVEWYVLYKMPKNSDSGWPFNVGEGYVYFSQKSQGEKWIESEESINDPDSAPGRTLQSVYDKRRNEDFIYAFYNNEPPGKYDDQTKGHTKGVVAFDASTKDGFWLVHSVPEFPPPADEGYTYPDRGRLYGQSFLCMTLPSTQLELVTRQLRYNCANIYDGLLSEDNKLKYPTMADVMYGDCESFETWSDVTLITPDGLQFRSFAKTSSYNDDLYSALVAPRLVKNLFTETFTRLTPMSDCLPSVCSTNDRCVANIVEVYVEVVNGNWLRFRSNDDHSKWAVSDSLPIDVYNQWVCIGDINRIESQKGRGGGTVCNMNPTLWKIFRQTAFAIELVPI